MDASTSFAILPSNVKQKTAFERKVNQVKAASWANNCLTVRLISVSSAAILLMKKLPA